MTTRLRAPRARATRRGVTAGPLHFQAFRRLFLVRLAGQFGDGVFQASLAGAILFNPERAAAASSIAIGFAVVLLPYSLLGPFVGVLIDQWPRQRILLVSNLVRAAVATMVGLEVAAHTPGLVFYASALVAISINRFVLASLSAALPHVVDAPVLVGASALSTTSGAIAATAGGASAIGLQVVIGSGHTGYAAAAVAALLPYALAAWGATRFDRDALGPDATELAQCETVSVIVAGLVLGARHIRSRRPVWLGLAAIGASRFCYGVSSVCTVLLYRNYFVDDGIFRAGLSGLAQVVIMLATGGALAAVVTPAITRRIGLVRYPCALLIVAAATQLGFGLLFRQPAVLVAALVIGFISQAVKISVDTTVQLGIDDAFRGRVFSLYDTLFNVTFVSAAVVTALVLPEDGRTVAGVVAVAIGYLLVGVWYATRRGSSVAVLRLSPVTSAALRPIA
ncbi:MAG: MFS transporter [Actinomycetota bacterium]|nr:MFS transporter [Actinomycetota bacterium]